MPVSTSEFLWRIKGHGYEAECWRNGDLQDVTVRRVATIVQACEWQNQAGRIVQLGDYAPRLRGQGLLAGISAVLGAGRVELLIRSKGEVEVLSEPACGGA